MSEYHVIFSKACIYIPKDYWRSNLTIIQRRKIGEVLQEAGLVSSSQVEKALIDQKFHTGLQLGEILALRGWIKQETADFFAQTWYAKLTSSEKAPLGYYLREAGLLNEEQVEAILKEQKTNWLKFGAIAVLKGWLKQPTVDFFIKNLFPDHVSDSLYVTKNTYTSQTETKTTIDTESNNHRQDILSSDRLTIDWLL